VAGSVTIGKGADPGYYSRQASRGTDYYAGGAGQEKPGSEPAGTWTGDGCPDLGLENGGRSTTRRSGSSSAVTSTRVMARGSAGRCRTGTPRTSTPACCTLSRRRRLSGRTNCGFSAAESFQGREHVEDRGAPGGLVAEDALVAELHLPLGDAALADCGGLPAGGEHRHGAAEDDAAQAEESGHLCGRHVTLTWSGGHRRR
jgi:hypothetical protein